MSTVTHTPASMQTRGRWIFCLLAAFFALPVVIVTLMYKFEWHPAGQSQGELIAPPRQIALPDGLLDPEDKPLPPSLLRDKWSMVYVSAQCADDCMQRLHTMRQLHASMAKDSQRIQRILVTRDADWQRLRTEYPDMLIINRPEATAMTFAQSFADRPSEDRPIYLVDPLANLMMRFPDTAEPRAIRKDLVRLLKAAWAG